MTASFFSASAEAADVRASGGIAFGSTQITFKDSSFKDNSGMMLAVEYDMTHRLALQAEYFASGVFPGLKSSGTYSGACVRWFFQSPMPQDVPNDPNLNLKSYFSQKNIAQFVGGGVGYAASSVLTSTVLEERGVADGIFVTLRYGIEYPFGGEWGSRAEVLYGQIASGTGSFNITDAVFSIYHFL